MPNIKDHVTSTEANRPGVGGELRQIKTNGAATAGEIREFIGSLKGRSPNEVLGVVAQSGLTRSIVLATVGFVVILVVFSVVPYGYNKMWPATAAATKADDEVDANQDDVNSANTETPQQAATANSETPAGAGNVADTLGIGETKTSDPKSNPLDSDNKLDSLLDGVD